MGVEIEGLERRVSPQKRLLLDTATLIAYLNDVEVVSPLAAHIVDEWIQGARNPAFVSVITVMEILVRPLRQKDASFNDARAFLTHFPHLSIVDVDINVATEAARLRAHYNLKPPDALIIATGLVHGAHFLVTNDGQWKTKLSSTTVSTEILTLSEFYTCSD